MNDKIEFTSLFSGCGGMDYGIHAAGFQTVYANEYDKRIVSTYRKNFPGVEVDTGDIRAINFEDLPNTRGIIGSPPCFAAGTLVRTIDGYTPIECIQEGDLVLTHANRWRPVTSVMSRVSKVVTHVKLMGTDRPLVTTPEHPFYAVTKKRSGINGRREFSKVDWHEASSLTNNHCVYQPCPVIACTGLSSPNSSELSLDSVDFWYLIGLYVGDGWSNKRSSVPKLKRGTPRSRGGDEYSQKTAYDFNICAAAKDVEHVRDAIARAGFHAYEYAPKKSNVTRFTINKRALYEFAGQFGRKAAEKRVAEIVYMLSPELIRAFVDGYTFADGCTTNPKFVSYTTVSRSLAMGMAELLRFLNRRSCSYSKFARPATTVIENRTVRQRDTFKLIQPFNDRYGHFDSFGNFYQVRSVETRHDQTVVYNISVEDDESYVVESFAVHNCQSWSAAGAGRGALDPRGKLFYVYCDIIAAKKPEFFVAENVAGMLHGKKAEAFQYLIGQLKSCGYHVAYKLVDCADYGVPQNRERVFIVGLRNDTYDSEFVFPEPTHIGNRTTLKDAIGDLGAPQELSQNRNNQWDSFNHEYASGTWSPHFMSRQRVRSWDECSYTIPATGRHVPLHPSANKMISAGQDKYVFDPDTPCPYRRLSVRECARIQTFPDDFVFEYDAIDTGYLMVGNAVPVEMARVIGVALKERLLLGK